MGAGAGAASNHGWFLEVFGFAEHSYARTKSQFSYDAKTGILKAAPSGGTDLSSRPSRTFVAGRFETPSLKELRARVDVEAAAKKLGQQRLTLKEIVDDASLLHDKPEHRFALFQAASQFNTLEHTSQHGTAEKGITCYCGDHTQGPSCAIACAPGTVVRNYFGLDGTGQLERQVYNLEDIERLLENDQEGYFEVMNGYTLSKDSDLKRLSEVLVDDESLGENIRSLLKIGVQSDTEVVCTSFGASMYKGAKREQLVTQAYCSAVSVSYSRCQAKNWEIFARLILDALYEATLYVAVENALRHLDAPGARKVFLTAVGGGVFGNDMEWVHDAILRAIRLFEPVGLEVYLVSFRASDPAFARLEEGWKKTT